MERDSKEQRIIAKLVDQLISAKKIKSDAETDIADFQGKILEFISAGDTEIVETPSGTYKVTSVQVERTAVNEDVLFEGLDVSVVSKITRRQLDNRLLEAAVLMGDVPADLLKSATTTSLNKPFVKITETR